MQISAAKTKYQYVDKSTKPPIYGLAQDCFSCVNWHLPPK